MAALMSNAGRPLSRAKLLEKSGRRVCRIRQTIAAHIETAPQDRGRPAAAAYSAGFGIGYKFAIGRPEVEDETSMWLISPVLIPSPKPR